MPEYYYLTPVWDISILHHQPSCCACANVILHLELLSYDNNIAQQQHGSNTTFVYHYI